MLNGIYLQFRDTESDYNRILFLSARLNRKAEPVIIAICLLLFLGTWAFAIIAAVMGYYYCAGKYNLPIDSTTNYVVFSIAAVFAILPFVFLIIWAVKSKRTEVRYQEELGEIHTKLWEHYCSIQNNPIPFEYCDPYSLMAILAIIQNGKADSVKESILVLDNECYQSSMLNLQGQVLEQARNAKNAAATAAVFSGLSLGVGAFRRI